MILEQVSKQEFEVQQFSQKDGWVLLSTSPLDNFGLAVTELSSWANKYAQHKFRILKKETVTTLSVHLEVGI